MYSATQFIYNRAVQRIERIRLPPFTGSPMATSIQIEPHVQRQLRVLIWCPFISSGGGAHFLQSLVSALAKHPKLALVRLVLPVPMKEWEHLLLPDSSRLEVKYLRSFQKIRRVWGIKGTGYLYNLWYNHSFSKDTSRLNQKILADLALDCDLIYIYWPHR